MWKTLWRKKAIGRERLTEQLAQCLSAFDLTFLGIGAIIGAGIFVLTGIVAATQTGPSIVFSYVLAGIACGLSALCYAELAAAVGGCGSAYGYAYAGFGELVAWIVGWDLLLEYAVSVSAVSVGWGSYFNDLLLSINVHIPSDLLHSPAAGGVLNLLSVCIIALLTLLLVVGVKSSARFNNLMVFLKLSVIFWFILIAVFNVTPSNWVPFTPFGWDGIVDGAAIIFFAYIGFDAVSTAAEEAINPQRDLPKGILYSLIICTILYIIVSLLLTGIVPYKELNVASPMSHALLLIGYKSSAAFIGLGAIAGLSTVMLVLFFGLTRIFFSMSRDGLLPHFFSTINLKTQTPVRIIILCGAVMATLGALTPIHDLAELVNIGTLFAFTIVCLGVIILRYSHPHLERPFKTPLMPYIPIAGAGCCLYLIAHLPALTMWRFVIWMLIGLVVYFAFSKKNSRLSNDHLVNDEKD